MMPPSTTAIPTPTSALREAVIRLPAVEEGRDRDRNHEIDTKEHERDPARRPPVEHPEADREGDDPPDPEKIDEAQETGEHAVFGQHREEDPEVGRARHADHAPGKLHRHS